MTDWIDKQPALRAVLSGAEQAEPDLDPEALASALIGGAYAFRWPSQPEAGGAFLIWQLMRRIAAEDSDPAAADRMSSTTRRPSARPGNQSHVA